MKKEQEVKKPKSVIDLFFKLGDLATQGDPKKLADFQYYMIWILFLAFATMFFTNIYTFFTTWDINSLIYAGIGFAIMSLQFFSLKNLHDARQMMQEKADAGEKVSNVVENVDDMLAGFGEEPTEKKKEKEELDQNSKDFEDKLKGIEVLDKNKKEEQDSDENK